MSLGGFIETDAKHRLNVRAQGHLETKPAKHEAAVPRASCSALLCGIRLRTGLAGSDPKQKYTTDRYQRGA